MKAVFLDRDGVINQNRDDYVKSWNEFTFLPGALEAIKELSITNKVVVITNQSGVGRGKMTKEDVNYIHEQMTRAVEEEGGRLDGVYFCPHAPEDKCACRKPLALLPALAALAHGFKSEEAYFVGDSVSDVETALAIGAKPVLVMTGRGREQMGLLPIKTIEECTIVENIVEATKYITT